MTYRVTLIDHATHDRHVSTWCVTDDEGKDGAINAAMVCAYGQIRRGVRIVVEPVQRVPMPAFKRRMREDQIEALRGAA